MKPIHTKTLPLFFKAIREDRGFSIRKWAELIGVAMSQVTKAENGETQEPKSYLKSIYPWLSKSEFDHALDLMRDQLEKEISGG